ncbi:carbohydrate binding domain-containing protein [Solirubrobacter taibaiensis]|nr:carbohydrate binding domain-containing protein [Solirubrobacter taibaiensis]
MLRFVLLASLLATLLVAPAAHAEPNMLRNASFEVGGLAGWAVAGAGQATTLTTPGVAREGAGYGATSATIYQDIVQDISGTHSYAFSLWVRSASGKPLAGSIQLIGLSDTTNLGTAPFTADGAWQLVSVTLDTAQMHSGMRAQINVPASGDQLLVDGAQVLHTHMFNPGFDRPNTGWSGRDVSLQYVESADRRDGTRVGLLTASTAAGELFQNWSTDRSDPWTYSIWVRSASGMPVRGAVSLAPGTPAASFTAGRTWQLVMTTVIPVTPAAGTRTALRPTVSLQEPGLGVYLDGAQLTVSPELGNASFEQPFFRAWDRFPRGPLAFLASQPGPAVEGGTVGAARTDVAGRSFAQELNVATPAGASQTFSAWVRSPSPGGAGGSLVLTGTGGEEASATPFQAGWDWTFVSAPLNATEARSGLRAEVVLDTPGRELQVDAASLASGNAREGLLPLPPPQPPEAPPQAPADADGDGVPDAADVCSKLKGGAIRRGCPLGLTNDTSISYVRTKRGIRIVRYYVEATKGARVVVTCSKGCRKTVTKGKGARRVPITRLRNRALRNGTRITVKVTMPGRLTTTVVDRVAKRRRIEGRRACVQPGTTKPQITC